MERPIEVGDRVRVTHGVGIGSEGKVISAGRGWCTLRLDGDQGTYGCDIDRLERINERRFWCVWREGGGSPTVKHPRREDAVSEAARLATINAGDTFHVLEAVASARAEDVAIIDAKTGERLPTPDPMPF